MHRRERLNTLETHALVFFVSTCYPVSGGRHAAGRHVDDMYMMMYIIAMSRRYSIADARMRLPTIIDQAEAGERIELTRRGKPVAVVVSLREFERLRGDRPRFADAYKKFLNKYSLAEIGVDEDFAATTRDRSRGRKVSM